MRDQQTKPKGQIQIAGLTDYKRAQNQNQQHQINRQNGGL